MRTSLKSLIVAVIVMMFCLPATAFAKPHRNHSEGGNHHQEQHNPNRHKHRQHGSPNVQQCGMTNDQFATFVSLVNNTTFRSQKKDIIEIAASSNTFTVAQVIQTMSLMTFSGDKVDVAAAMYHSVCDYNNWYMVYSVFDFEMYARDLRKKIGQ